MRISRKARNSYRFEDNLFAHDGRVQLTEYANARQFAGKISAVRGAPVPASEINAMALMDEVLRIIIRQYEMQNPGVMSRADQSLASKYGTDSVEGVLTAFVSEFPPQPVYHANQSPRSWLSASTGDRPHRQLTVEELLLLHVTQLNPAIHPYNDLFDDSALRHNDAYAPLIHGLTDFFNGEKGFGSDHGSKGHSAETLVQVLRAPALASPYSIEGQLQFLLAKWGNILGEAFVQRLLRGIDFVKEEAIRGNFAGGFAGEAPVLEFSGQPEYERFSPDKDWMPRLVLIAKNTYVWLDQLSRQYGREISRLDQIPDEELDLLARRGFTGLWLIGLWERSVASKRIKQSMGQDDAVASAYSLMNYDIAGDLGGWAALENLRWRAWQRGVRLSADMVPNHMGIDSRWVVEHPDWFLSLRYSPYPNYSFHGQDLSNDERVGIYLEDHYYDKTDAAVVFKRIDRWTGDVRYIYHGNDGTSMPWNDTAQLNYLKAEVREAVIQTILHVARNFPIIRFDAAMTLAKKHIQRLWFPEPGAGGAIPSRSEHGLTRAQFEAAIPEEFWREVVDRVAAEVPDTLLLAEAFWLMEGYFVRTLGMHRVYNSAFMHMLRDEDNGKYRTVMKNILEFDPRILQRFVNFMNNPDEKTAVEQFGKADKYFGVCVVLSTMPGLSMFGHGQVEGYREKYGMEFRRPKWDEQPDEGFIRYHDQVIFPLLHKRYLFAGVESFRLYDFFAPEGHVNEDVFAYSNRHGDERSLVIYHNKYADARGWVRTSVGYADGSGIVQQSLAQGLGLPGDGFAIFRDSMTGMEYIRSCSDLAANGLYAELGAYKCHVFIDWRFVGGEQWAQVAQSLNGAGYWSMQARWDELFGKKEEEKKEEPVVKKKRAARTKAKVEKTATPKKPKTSKQTE